FVLHMIHFRLKKSRDHVALHKTIPGETQSFEHQSMGGSVMAAKLVFPALRSAGRSEEHTSELQSPYVIVCRLLLEKKKKKPQTFITSLSSNLPRFPWSTLFPYTTLFRSFVLHMIHFRLKKSRDHVALHKTIPGETQSFEHQSMGGSVMAAKLVFPALRSAG